MKAATWCVVAVAVLLTGSPALSSPRVLIISVDGCRPDALQVANTPNIDALAARGSASYDARNIMDYGGSGPNYSSMLTGVNWPKHGVTSNSTGAYGFVGNHFDVWPHMFKRIETFNPSLYTAQFVGWGPINPGTWADRYADQVGASGDAGNVADIVTLLQTGDPDVIFLQLSGVDTAGHASGFSPTSSAYLSAIETADTRCGTLLDALYHRPGYLDGTESWLVLAVTDHGGKDKEHVLPSGGAEVYTTFYIAAGPGAAVGADLGSPRVYDVAVTTMAYLGLDTSGMSLDGQVVLPEPATLALLAVGGLWLLRRRAPR